MQVLHTVLERNPEEVARKVAVEVVQAVHSTVEVAVPIVVVHKAVEVARKVAAEAVPVVHKVIEAVAPDLAAEAGLDHKTWIIPPVIYVIISN